MHTEGKELYIVYVQYYKFQVIIHTKQVIVVDVTPGLFYMLHMLPYLFSQHPFYKKKKMYSNNYIFSEFACHSKG